MGRLDPWPSKSTAYTQIFFYLSLISLSVIDSIKQNGVNIRVNDFRQSKISASRKFKPIETFSQSKISASRNFLPVKNFHQSKISTSRKCPVENVHQSKMSTSRKYLPVENFQSKITSRKFAVCYETFHKTFLLILIYFQTRPARLWLGKVKLGGKVRPLTL